MPVPNNHCSVPVLLLYDLDPSWTREEKDEIDALSAQLGDAIAAAGHPTDLVPVEDENIAAALEDYDAMEHVVLNWCESVPGVPHSEQAVAETLESLGFAYTGAPPAALELAEDKRRMKQLCDRAGIPTPEWRVYGRADAGGWNRFPAIVKAANEHCSEGITRESVVMSAQELEERIAIVLDTCRQPALVEDFIDGREFHVWLWGNGHISMLPPVEMDFSSFSDIHDRLCSYDAKFVPGSAHYEGIEIIAPSLLDGGSLAELERVCRAAYTAVGCRDYGRIDVRARDGVFHVLDVNPNADISPDASLAWAAECAGYTYGEAGSRIVKLAALRHPVWCDDAELHSALAAGDPCACRT